jgi:hypothetical protein
MVPGAWLPRSARWLRVTLGVVLLIHARNLAEGFSLVQDACSQLGQQFLIAATPNLPDLTLREFLDGA